MATALTRYTPTTGTELTRLPDMISRLFDESFVMPSVFDRSFRQVLGSNLYETDDEYIVHVALPGIDAEQMDIQVTGQQLTLKGSYSIPTPENATVVWKGIGESSFVESMTLPGEVDTSKAGARYEHGILSITLPKTEHAKPKSITVSVAK
jgi:HSP20 family protein